MFCLNCGVWIGEKSGVCANCATIDLAQNDFRYEGTTQNLNVPQSLITQISPSPVSVQTRIIEKPKKSKFFLGFSLATILFLLSGFGAAALAVVLIDWKQVFKSQQMPKKESTVLIDATFSIAANDSRIQSFEIYSPSDLSGNFAVNGGDIDFLIVDEANLEKFKNKEDVSTQFFLSASRGEVKRFLLEGRYFLILNNPKNQNENKVTVKLEIK